MVPAEIVPDRETPGAYVVRVGGADQSWVDPDDPTRLEFDYMQRIADIVDASFPPGERLRVVHIGGGGMSLPRYLAATRPTSAQLVFEPDAELTAQVRSVIPLPARSGIKVRPVDGVTGLAQLRAEYADLVILDAFVGPRTPAELATVETFTRIGEVLRPGGTFLMNLTDEMSLNYSRRVARGIADVFPEALLCAEPSVLKGRRFGNIVMAGSRRALPVAALNRAFAGAAFPYRLMTGTALERFTAAMPPFTAQESAASPAPPSGPGHFG